MKRLATLVLAGLLSGCMSAPWHKSRVEEKVAGCIASGVNVASAAECLKKKGVTLKRNEHAAQHYYYISCWPYWGYPFVYSCGTVNIQTNDDGIIESWKVDGTIEKLHA
jgi:hypothetical protein